MKKIITIICFFMIMTFAACGEKTEEQKSELNSKTQSETGADERKNVDETDIKFPYRKTIVAGTESSLGIDKDGKLYESRGDNSKIIMENVVSVDVGVSDIGYIALKDDGTVSVPELNLVQDDWKYIRNGLKELTEWTDIIAVAAGGVRFAGLKADGTVEVNSIPSQYNDSIERIVEEWTDIIAIDAAIISGDMVGLKSDGTVVCSGFMDVSSWTDIIAVSRNRQTVFGLKQDGTVVWSSDYDAYEEISSWTDIVAISAGKEYCVGLKSDGTVVSARTEDASNYKQWAVEEWTDIVAVSAGVDYTLGLKSDGTVLVVGDKFQSGFNVGEWTNIQIP